MLVVRLVMCAVYHACRRRTPRYERTASCCAWCSFQQRELAPVRTVLAVVAGLAGIEAVEIAKQVGRMKSGLAVAQAVVLAVVVQRRLPGS